MYEIETNAPFTAAADIASEALAYVTNPTQGGRLGVSFTLNATAADVVARALGQAGFTARVTPLRLDCCPSPEHDLPR